VANNLNFAAAFQANTGDLWITGRGYNPGDMKLGMMPGTNPSITLLPNGGWQAAFQSNTGNLWIVGTQDNRGDTKLGMMKGTSPSITALPDGGWQAAFQANTGNLWVVGTKDDRGDTGYGMMKGTNPSITALPDGGWQAAFQANTGKLWIVGTDDDRGDMNLGMIAETTPSISAAGAGNGWQAAFQASTGNLWIVGTEDNRGDMQLGMMKGTSPSICGLADGSWQAAFQANTGHLWVIGSKVNLGDLKLGMMAGTSPSIVSLVEQNWQVSFQANSGNLWTVGTLDNTGDQKLGMDKTTSPCVSSSCIYPAYYPTSAPIGAMLNGLLANSGACTSLYLDTSYGEGGGSGRNEKNHAQGLARTHKLSDGSIYFFLTYSAIGAKGTLSQYRYVGPVEGSHVAEANPLRDPKAVAPKAQAINVSDEHPADLVFLQDINNADAGYVFVTEESQSHCVSVYFWEIEQNFKYLGQIDFGLRRNDGKGPNFLFLDRVNDYYYLGIAEGSLQLGQLFRARSELLFPTTSSGGLDVKAFSLVPNAEITGSGTAQGQQGVFSFPVNSDASQVKLIRDSTGQWYLLGFRSVPPDQTEGTDYIDTYLVNFAQFSITPEGQPSHVIFAAGDTGFCSTGTHYVEPAGRLLVSSSYRWAKDDLSGGAGYVSRVDECPSS
jgi:hypothetical protein